MAVIPESEVPSVFTVETSTSNDVGTTTTSNNVISNNNNLISNDIQSSNDSPGNDTLPGWRFYYAMAGLSAVQFSSFVSMFVLSSFFLQVCEDKGVSGIVRGIIVGSVQFVFIFMAYVFLGLVHKAALKYQIAIGLAVAGFTLLAFAFTDRISNNPTFVFTCLLLRALQGTAITVSDVCAFIAANKASPPEKLGTVIGWMELCVALALALSPVLGGWLYQVGGYSAPFLVSSGMLFFSSIVSIPTIPKEVNVKQKSISQMVKDTFKVKLFCTQLMIAGGFLGFFSGMIEPHLREFHLTPVVVGVVIFVTNAFSGFAFPVWGFISDWTKKPAAVVIVSCIIGCVGLIFFGPFPGIQIPSLLWVVVISLALCGVSLSGFLIATYAQMRAALGKICLSEEDADTVASAAYIATANFGCFLGAVLGGMFIDYLGYSNGSAVLFGIQLLAIVIQLGLQWLSKKDRIYKFNS